MTVLKTLTLAVFIGSCAVNVPARPDGAGEQLRANDSDEVVHDDMQGVSEAEHVDAELVAAIDGIGPETSVTLAEIKSEVQDSDADLALPDADLLETQTIDVDSVNSQDSLEPTEPSKAPLDCPNLPAMCPAWRQILWEQPFSGNFVAVKGHPEFLNSAWSRWRPIKIQQIGENSVRVWATWRNQRNVNLDISQVKSSFGKPEPNYLTGCAMLKPSLLPTGCITVDVSTKSNVVTGYQFFAKDAMSWPKITIEKPDVLDAEPEIGCPQVSGSPALPLQITMTDGLVVRAFEGHANLEVLAADEAADPSAVYRNNSTPNMQLSAVEIASAITETQVELDVSVCRASVNDIVTSGCACPAAAVPAVNPVPTGDHILVTAGGASLMLTPDFISATEPAGWTGAGYKKISGVNTIDGVQSAPCCTGPSCPAEAKDWQCGGNGYDQFGGPALAEVRLLRTVYTALDVSVVPKGQAGVGWLGALPAASLAQTFFQFRNGLAPRDTVARKRDGVQYNCVITGDDSDANVSGLTATSTQLEFNTKARCCSIHFAQAVKGPQGYVDNDKCKVVTVSLAATLTRWSVP